MAKVKYYYDSDTLSYQKIQCKKGDKFKRLFLLLLLLLFFDYWFCSFTPVFESPKEKALKRELEFENSMKNYIQKIVKEEVLDGIARTRQ